MTDRICSVDGCERRVLARGWCSRCYQRWKVHGDPLGSANRRTADGLCSIEGCHKPFLARGLCQMHYYRLKRHGSTDHPMAYANAPIGMKWCPQCVCYKAKNEFTICRSTVSGYQSWCKRCVKSLEPRYVDSRTAAGRRRRAKRRGGRVERYTTESIADRDGWVCQICRKRIGRKLRFPHPRSLSIDHIIPVSKDGDDVKSNVQAVHLRCNESKGNRGTDQLRLIG